MRKIFDFLLLILLVLFVFWQKEKAISSFRFLLSSPCDQPLTYKIGEVDKGYGLTETQFAQRITEAGQIWDKAVNKNLFQENREGKITINLIYSDLQSLNDKINSLQNKLKSKSNDLNSQIAEYNSLKTDFQNKLRTFNNEVNNWNRLGGAPQDVFNQLKSQQSELQAEADKLNQMAASLNLKAESYNLNLSQYNQSVQNFKQVAGVKPEAGVYDGPNSQINIYLTSSRKELIHTLAHELGHALSLKHFEDPKAIMYPYTSEIIYPNGEETYELQAYCEKKNYEYAFQNLIKLINKE